MDKFIIPIKMKELILSIKDTSSSFVESKSVFIGHIPLVKFNYSIIKRSDIDKPYIVSSDFFKIKDEFKRYSEENEAQEFAIKLAKTIIKTKFLIQ